MKNMNKAFGIWVCSLLITAVLPATGVGDSVSNGFEVLPVISHGSHTKVLVRIDSDVASLPRGSEVVGGRPGEWIDVIMYRYQMMDLKGVDSSVLLWDVDAYLESIRGEYYTLAEIESILQDIANDHPEITNLFTIGTTYEGRNIWCLEITDNPGVDEGEPGVFYMGLHHAREWPTVNICLYIANQLTDLYGTNSTITYLVDNRRVWIVTCVNPDGYYYCHDLGNDWRKNRRYFPEHDTYGVDLNRNYGGSSNGDPWGSWGSVGPASVSHNPPSSTYCGPWVFSEAETQAVRDIFLENDICAAISWHTYGELVLWCWGYTTAKVTPDDEYMSEVGQEIASRITKQSGSGTYTPQQASSLYPVTGDTCDWAYGYGHYVQGRPTFAYTIEACSSFHPDEIYLDQICEENFDGALYLLQEAGNISNVTRRVLPPIIDDLGSDEDGNYTVSWEEQNPEAEAEYFQLDELTDLTLVRDDAESGSGLWELSGFSISDENYHSGSYSFKSRSNVNNDVSSMTTVFPTPVSGDMSLSFWCWYDIENNYDYAFVEVSRDGRYYTLLDTFTGSSDGWVYKEYSLDDYVDESVFIRFRYTTDSGTLEEGFYLDDISPVSDFGSVTVLSDSITDNYYEITNQPDGVYYYRVRGYNSARGWGDFSTLEKIMVGPEHPELSYYPESHDFGEMMAGETNSTTFEIWNSGTGTLTYNLSEPCDWVDVSPTSGESTGEHDTITVYIDTTGLPPGLHQCDILIDSNGGTGVFSVYVKVVTDQLDQEQTQGNYNFVAYDGRWGAQSFKPTLETLTRVILLVHKKGNPPDNLVVSIRDSLTGEDLTMVSKPSAEIPSESDWIEFDFEDIAVTPGDTYYIVLRTTGGNNANSYVWRFGYHTAYTDGELWYSSNAGSSWIKYIQYDFCFKTYGRTTPPNVPPVAEDDSYTTSEDTQLSVDAPGVLENDHDPDSGPNPLTAVLVDDVTHGTLILNSDGSFTYDPDPDYYGTDSFTYQAYDGEDYSNTATVTIDVEGVNDPPTAVDDSYTTPENTQLNVAAPGVLGNDIDDSPLTAVLVDDVTHGTLTLNSDGSFTYNPDPGYIGTDSFTYQAYDGEYYSNVATVTITIYHVNDPPVAENDTYTTSEDTQLNVDAPGVLENDHDPDDGPNPLTAVLVDDVTHGTLTLNSDGSFTYNPDPDYYGTDSFTYQAYDGEDYSNTATVTIDVTSVNDPPVAVDDTAETAPDTPVEIPVTDNDYDIDGTIDTTTVTIQTDASHGSTEVDPVTGVVTYTPDPGYEGPDSFTYTVNDNEGANSNIATVNITVVSPEELDQEQTQGIFNFVAYGSRWGSQSFKPTLETLTRVELRVRRRGNPPNNLVVSIRDSLTGEDLTVISKPPSEIPSTVSWIDFDFEDISVTPGETYYIVLRTTGGNSLNSYIWKFGYNTPYTDGEMWFSSNAGASWSRYPQYDFCFKTYGIG
jgi:VCBS repeat-containing protein